MNQNLIYQIGLTMIKGVGDILARQLLQTVGSAEAIFQEKPAALEKIPGIGRRLAREIVRPEVLRRAEREISFIEKKQIKTYFITDPDYPYRLKECIDAPVLFYYKGEANLNSRRIISIVGTRNATSYGRDILTTFIRQLSASLPELIIISGLAYGIDIYTHRCCLTEGVPTVAVLAHGLDRIYPPAHRQTAIDMLQQGGLLSDFPSDTNPDKPNFIKRNRLVAGLADTTIVVESAEKGGSLITADLAFSYGREVFTFPGRVSDLQSAGCHKLIKEHKAGLITSASDLLSVMGWENYSQPEHEAQSSFTFSDTDEIEKISRLIREQGEVQLNQLALLADTPVHILTSLLFELELNGCIQVCPGNIYKWK